MDKIERNCLHCGKLFTVDPADPNYIGKKYCKKLHKQTAKKKRSKARKAAMISF